MTKTTKKLYLKKKEKTSRKTRQLKKTRKINKNKIGGDLNLRKTFKKAGRFIGFVRKSDQAIDEDIIKLYDAYICHLLKNMNPANVNQSCLHREDEIIRVMKLYLDILSDNNDYKKAFKGIKESFKKEKGYNIISNEFKLVKTDNLNDFTKFFMDLQTYAIGT